MKEKTLESLNESHNVTWTDKSGTSHSVSQLDGNEIYKRNVWFKYVFFPLLKGQPIKPKMDLGQLAKLSVYARTLKNLIIGNAVAWDETTQSLIALAIDIPEKNLSGVVTSDIGKYIASFCQEYSITIDDTKYSKDELKKAAVTFLYIELEKFGVLASVKASWNGTEPALTFPKPASNKTQPKHSNPAPSGQPGPSPMPQQQSTSASTAKVSYRPTLANSVGIQGGKVTFPPGTDLVFIKGDWNPPRKTNPRVHTKPRRSFANGQGDPCIYWDMTGQGYEDCILYWDKTGLQEARALESALNSRKPSGISSYYLRKVKANGEYFQIKVACQFNSRGYVIAYIQAARLQEMLDREKDA